MKNIWHYKSPIGTLWIAEENQAITYLKFDKGSKDWSAYKQNETTLIKKAENQLTEYFNGNREKFTLPIAPQGTEFQKTVWEALLNIPYGETRSYKDIATTINNPKAARAVGLANNRNPIAVIIPCHRVVGHDGSLTGYAGGLDIKRFLLDLEGSNPKKMFFSYGEKEIEHLKSCDPQLSSAISEIGHVYRSVVPDMYMALIKSIIGQQISTKAQVSIWNRIQKEIPQINPETIDNLPLDELQAYGISGRKASYIKEMTTAILNGTLDLDSLNTMTDEEVSSYLTKIKGVGQWTAEMLLIFSLQRPNILSWGDLAIHRGLRMLYSHQKITPKLFEKYQKRYSPYASVASLYLWKIAGGAIPYLTDPAVK
ncbi:MAG TPA: methylated-DNA--[protein]-cysteine S-methyltransferase [Syntrophomonadaceae bacterium]|nr:methylated-DNA--[protein]-cysteine S-methyltransferase [Syntrophomonadaceae bacterium]